MTGPRIVALGGGHGLAASLTAARRISSAITAIVTVADDGGSSGRIRRELPVLPPGDLRMALASLAGAQPEYAEMASLLQHRFGGHGALAGHPVGNLLLTGLAEIHDGDAVAALDTVGRLVGAVGRVLPMSTIPLEIAAWVDGVDEDDPRRRRLIRGQVAVATTPGRVREVHLVPADPPASAAAVEAIGSADLVLLGPGSWFTSVLPHLLVPGLRDALQRTAARVVVVLNLEPQPGETEGFSPQEHLRVLARHAPDVPISVVVADRDLVFDRRGLRRAADSLRCSDEGGPQLVLAPLAAVGSSGRHDPDLLAAALGQLLDQHPRVAG